MLYSLLVSLPLCCSAPSFSSLRGTISLRDDIYQYTVADVKLFPCAINLGEHLSRNLARKPVWKCVILTMYHPLAPMLWYENTQRDEKRKKITLQIQTQVTMLDYFFFVLFLSLYTQRACIWTCSSTSHSGRWIQNFNNTFYFLSCSSNLCNVNRQIEHMLATCQSDL